MDGRVKLKYNIYKDQAYLGKTAETSTWTKPMIDNLIEKAKREAPMKYGSEGLTLHDGFKNYDSFVRNKRGIVVGSEDPWVEAIALSHGAAKILTVEFGSIESSHEQVETMIPKEFTEAFLNGHIEPFDFGISFSSLEHDGLGRYGDVLNPIGDLQSMAKMLSVIKPGGLMFVGFPTAEQDLLEFNGHRVYGLHRLPKMFAGWKLVHVFHKRIPNAHYRQQRLFVLQNLNGCRD